LETNANDLVERYFGPMPEAGDPAIAATRRVVRQQQPPMPPPSETPSELLTLKPGLWGKSIDLKEAGRRLCRWLQRRQGER
jgi:hypothetical protein